MRKNTMAGNSFFSKEKVEVSAAIITSQLRAISSLIIGMQRVAWPRPQSSGHIKMRGLSILLLKWLPVVKRLQ